MNATYPPHIVTAARLQGITPQELAHRLATWTEQDWQAAEDAMNTPGSAR